MGGRHGNLFKGHYIEAREEKSDGHDQCCQSHRRTVYRRMSAMRTLVFSVRRREPLTRSFRDGGMHPSLSRVRAGMRCLRDPAVGRLTVWISAVRCLRGSLRRVRRRVRKIHGHGNHAEMCRGVPPVREDVPGSREVRSCSTGCLALPLGKPLVQTRFGTSVWLKPVTSKSVAGRRWVVIHHARERMLQIHPCFPCCPRKIRQIVCDR
jgi:hypothetical protein